LDSLTHAAVNAGNVFETRGGCPIFSGNLIRNGRFEEGLSHWESRNVKIVTGKEPHEGKGAAGLGARKNNKKSAYLLQRVPLAPGPSSTFLQLSFSVAGRQRAPADLDVRLSWLDRRGSAIGDGITAHIQRRAIGNGTKGEWNAYTFVSERLPAGAAYALLKFYKKPGKKRRQFLTIDDVLLIPVL